MRFDFEATPVSLSSVLVILQRAQAHSI